MKSARRPNSLISLGSSFSSGTSSSSLCTSTSSSNGSHSRNTGNMTLELINETKPLQTTVHLRKHQRSTTLVSQLSMGEWCEGIRNFILFYQTKKIFREWHHCWYVNVTGCGYQYGTTNVVDMHTKIKFFNIHTTNRPKTHRWNTLKYKYCRSIHNCWFNSRPSLKEIEVLIKKQMFFCKKNQNFESFWSL